MMLLANWMTLIVCRRESPSERHVERHVHFASPWRTASRQKEAGIVAKDWARYGFVGADSAVQIGIVASANG